jgi:hypothetical protein
MADWGFLTIISGCQWLQKLHSNGLLSGSFRPDDQDPYQLATILSP